MAYLTHRKRDDRPWGYFEQFTQNEQTTVKLLFVKAGESISLQKHSHRKEFWHIVSGSGILTLGEETRDVHKGEECVIEKETLHRIEGKGDGVLILEIAFGDFDENDIERVSDHYGRS